MSHADDAGSDTARRADGNGPLTDMRISLTRWLRKTSRNPYVTFSSLVQPVIFFVLMAEVLGAVAGPALAATVGDVHYVTYLTPAIVIQSALAAAAVSGIGLVDDMETGMFEKTLVSPMHRGAMFLGKVCSEVVRIAVQTLIILALGYGMLALTSDATTAGYLRTGLPGLIGIVGVTVLFGGVFMAYSNVVALVTRDREATIMIANLLTFPLLFVSSAFLPLSVLPGWIRAVAVVNPITYGVDGIRALMLGRDVLSVFDVTAFGGLWNTVVPAAAVLLACNLVLGAAALRLLGDAAKAEVH
ncbi:ABC-2 type transport system permease protein [Halorientalis persicus]|uniref:ABC-2 type transport system permease protein n=1 Tax=Halorientalis persicus TaxID=1367881 RepID=A0A1H8P076_9EURY|nr:ABC transporter permease [Halorientalis persicus]SEO35320.1 ABC-2 type transport system permease protein [Halorientalis persicus]